MNRNNTSGLLVVTGASGAGKTSAVRLLEARGRQRLRCFYFDSIGVPSIEAMERDYGGAEQWQAESTQRWLLRIAAVSESGSLAVLDGQTRPSFVYAAQRQVPALRVRVILLDCSSAVRRQRLAVRGQPELASLQMDMWAAYLRGQADAFDLHVVDTTEMTIEEVAAAIDIESHSL